MHKPSEFLTDESQYSTRLWECAHVAPDDSYRELPTDGHRTQARFAGGS